MGRNSCRVRLVDSSPTRDVSRSDSVSRTSESALTTGKGCLGGTIGLGDMPTSGTCARSIPRIDKNHQDTGKNSLVLDEGAKLMERPGMMDTTLSLANRDPVTDSLEFFKSDTAPGAFGLRDQSFADRMVDVRGKTEFLALTFLQEPLGGLGSLGLQPLPEFSVTFPQAVDLTAGIAVAIGVGSDIDNAEINAEPVPGVIGRRFRHIHHHGKVKCAVTVDEIGLAANAFQPGSLVLTKDDGDNLPTLERQDGYPVKPLPGQDALVIDDGTMGLESGLLGFVPLVRFGDLADSADSQLGRQIEPLSDVVVNDLLEPDLVGGAFPEGDFSDSIASHVEPLHRLQKSGDLFRGWLEFNHQRQIHKKSITRCVQ